MQEGEHSIPRASYLFLRRESNSFINVGALPTIGHKSPAPCLGGGCHQSVLWAGASVCAVDMDGALVPGCGCVGIARPD